MVFVTGEFWFFILCLLDPFVFCLAVPFFGTSSSGFVGRAHIRELVDKIAVGSYFILRNLSIYDDCQEGVEDVLGECPAINGKARLARWVIGQKIW